MIPRATVTAWLRRPGAIAAIVWLVVFVVALLTGERVDTGVLATDWQVLPLPALRGDPMQSVWHLHTQPPLWNMVIAVALRIGPAVSFTVLMACAGAVLAWSLAELALLVGAGRRTAVALALLGSLSGPVLSNAFVARYELPVAALLTLLTLTAVSHRVQLVAPLLAFSVVMIRSLYHPVWIVVVVALWWWCRRRELPWRRVLLASALPLVMIGGWMVKNDAQVGDLTLSSWSGMNLLRSVQGAVAQDRLDRLVEEGTISPVGAVPSFSPYESYEPLVEPCTAPTSPAAVADRTRGTTRSPFTGQMEPVTNFNHACFVPVYAAAGSDALSLIRSEPRAWVKARLWSIDNWFGVPTSTDISESPVTRAIETVSHVLLVVVPQPFYPDSWRDSAVWVHGAPVSLLLILLTGVAVAASLRHLWRGLRRSAMLDARAVAILLGGATIVWTVVVGVTAELGEQERFRSMIDPLVIVLGGAISAAWVARRGGLRGVRGGGPDRRVAVTSAAAVVVLVVALVGVREGASPTLAERPDDAVALPTTSTTAATSDTTAPPVRPTCRTVVHLGDSNLGLARPLFEARYAALGVDARIDTANGRGATMARDGGTTALEAIDGAKAETGAAGRCWIIELSSADAAASGRDGLDPAVSIGLIHDAVGGEPTLWVTPVMVSTTTEWNLTASTAYNRALVATVADDPATTVVDWQDIALDHLDQFLADGVHYRPPLYDLLVATVVDAMQAAWDLQG